MSRTVALIVSVPDVFISPVVNDAVVYVAPFAVVLYEAIADPYEVVGVTVTENFDIPLMKPPYVSAYPVASVAVILQDGFTLVGIVHDLA